MNDLYESGLKKLSNYMDYLEIIKLLQQFNKLKSTLFSKEQTHIFNHSVKPRIFLNKLETNDEIDDPDSRIDEGDIVNYEQLYQIYKNMTTNKFCLIYKNILLMENKGEINERLIKKFDNDIKLPFDLLIKNKKQEIGFCVSLNVKCEM